MSKIFKIASSTLVMAAALSLSALSVSAEMYQEQSQSASQKTSFSCEGNGCSAEMKVTQKVEQSQSQGYSSGDWNRRSYKIGNNRGWTKNYHKKNKQGQVSLDWDDRGGTCHVRYTEAGAQNYNYSTSASCDEGGITIGGLQRGLNYRFQVKKDDGAWSPAITAKAS